MLVPANQAKWRRAVRASARYDLSEGRSDDDDDEEELVEDIFSLVMKMIDTETKS